MTEEQAREIAEAAAIMVTQYEMGLWIGWDNLIQALDDAGYTEDRCAELWAGRYGSVDAERTGIVSEFQKMLIEENRELLRQRELATVFVATLVAALNNDAPVEIACRVVLTDGPGEYININRTGDKQPLVDALHDLASSLGFAVLS